MAVRFPKEVYLNYDSSVSTAVSFGGTDFLQTDPRFNIPVAPSRYSQTRKVTFWLNVENTNATDLVVQLRINASSSSAASLALLTNDIGPVGGVFSNNDPFAGVLPGAGGVDPDLVLFDRKGASTTIAQRTGDAGAATVFIEFDRFNALDADFFSVWDTLTDDDNYTQFQWMLEIVSAGASPEGSTVIFGFGMNVLQAPSPENNTCTTIPMKYGRENSGTGNTTFDADATTQVRGLFRFRYIAAEWNGITAMHFLIHGGTKNNANGITYRLDRIDDDEDAQSSTTLLTETYTDPGAARHLYYRTADFFSLLVDGNDYVFDYDHIGNPTVADSNSGDNVAYLEIIQKETTLTNSYHYMNTVPTWVSGSKPDNAVHTFNQQGLIDPLWYEDMPDERFLTRRILSSLYHRTGANNPEMAVMVDANLTEDVSPSGTASTQLMSPRHTDDGSLTFQWDYRDQPITALDPINLAGKRRLIYFTSDTRQWIGGDGDHPGQLALVYNFTVPLTEAPELGPLFELDAFNPEGCASTAAGLGDPGKLVITNGETIPQKFDPEALKIEDNGVPTPFCDEVPSVTTQDAAVSPTGGLSLGTYVYRYTFRNCCTGKESDPNPDDITADTSGQSPAAQVTLSFAGVRIPSDSQICEICLYRTLAGGDFPVMAKVGCFNVDEASIFVDVLSDSALDFLNDGLSILNAPMPCTPVVVEFRNRLFAMGDIPDLAPAGSVSVVNGSDIVTGDNLVEWDRCLEGKYIQVEGDCRPYEIDKVLPPVAGVSPPIGRLKLVEDYEGVNGTNLSYTICGRPNRLYISEPLEPECWPAANFLDIEPGDGDRLMGGESNFNRLLICKRRKTYVATFKEQPATEINVPARISSDIGCIAPRSFAQIASGTVWLSDRGLAIYDGREVKHVKASDLMNNIFVDPDNPNYVRRDANGRVIDAVGVFYPKREQYLLLLPTVKTTRGASLMLVWDTSLGNITLLEFCQEFQAMTVAKDTDGNERVYLGDTNGFVWIYDLGDNDGIGFPNQTGTVRGTVTTAGVDIGTGASFLEDSTASFIEGGLPSLAGLSGVAGLSGAFGGISPADSSELGMAGACLYTRAAGAALDTPWVQRFIFASTPSRIFVTPGWGTEVPAVGDDYMLGAINLDLIFKSTNYGTDDMQKRDWGQIVTYEPEEVSSELRIELRPDFSTADPEELTVTDDQGVTGAGRVADLGFSGGRILMQVGRNIHNYLSPRFRNFAPDQPVRLLNHSMRKEPQAPG
jgi:hypothetical protein